MAKFESDLINSVTTNSYIPTGALIPMAGAIGKYDDISYVDMGLIPCDGRSLDTAIYTDLFAVIGYAYGGSGSNFSVPDFKTNKLTIRGATVGENVGTKVVTVNHNHSTVDMTWNALAANQEHTHSVTMFIGNMDYQAGHSHTADAVGTASGGANNTSSAATGSQTALVLGNHTHTASMSAANLDNSGVSGHSHNTVANGNIGTLATSSNHTHTSNASAAWTATTVAGTPANPLTVPYANVLFFIKA